MVRNKIKDESVASLSDMKERGYKINYLITIHLSVILNARLR